jgi:circadian clock protein KaiB
MRHAPKTANKEGKAGRGHYVLRLFIAGNGPNSKLALANLRSVCKEHLNGNCTIETVDVVKDFQAAVKNQVLVTPTLILVTPGPRVVILGNLSDKGKVLAALRLTGGVA